MFNGEEKMREEQFVAHQVQFGDTSPSERWHDCANHGSIGIANKLVKGPGAKWSLWACPESHELVCFECESVWKTDGNFTHP